MHQDLKVVLKIGKIEEKMSQTVGVRQGDCMAPVLFLFMVMAFVETLETEWVQCSRLVLPPLFDSFSLLFFQFFGRLLGLDTFWKWLIGVLGERRNVLISSTS